MVEAYNKHKERVSQAVEQTPQRSDSRNLDARKQPNRSNSTKKSIHPPPKQP